VPPSPAVWLVTHFIFVNWLFFPPPPYPDFFDFFSDLHDIRNPSSPPPVHHGSENQSDAISPPPAPAYISLFLEISLLVMHGLMLVKRSPPFGAALHFDPRFIPPFVSPIPLASPFKVQFFSPLPPPPYRKTFFPPCRATFFFSPPREAEAPFVTVCRAFPPPFPPPLLRTLLWPCGRADWYPVHCLPEVTPSTVARSPLPKCFPPKNFAVPVIAINVTTFDLMFVFFPRDLSLEKLGKGRSPLFPAMPAAKVIWSGPLKKVQEFCVFEAVRAIRIPKLSCCGHRPGFHVLFGDSPPEQERGVFFAESLLVVVSP